ncbi:MAG: metalloregulator ArsR/SmtB family transcription factor [Sneathiella sp.]
MTNTASQPDTSARDLMNIMGNEHRLHILTLLHKGEHNVGQLCGEVGLSQSALSQHLTRMRKLRIVTTRREGPTIFYSLSSAQVSAIIETLDAICTPALTAAA